MGQFGHMASVTLGRKFCTSPHHRGRKWLPASYFYPTEWFENGEIRRLQAHCQTCQRINTRIRGGHQPRRRKLGLRANPEGGYIFRNEQEREIYNEYQRQRYADMTSEQRKDRREYGRFYAEMRRRAQGIEPRQFKKRKTVVDSEPDKRVSAAPLQEFLIEYERYGGNIRQLEQDAGVGEELLIRVRDGTKTRIQLSSADKTLMAAGAQYMFDQLYPPQIEAA